MVISMLTLVPPILVAILKVMETETHLHYRGGPALRKLSHHRINVMTLTILMVICWNYVFKTRGTMCFAWGRTARSPTISSTRYSRGSRQGEKKYYDYLKKTNNFVNIQTGAKMFKNIFCTNAFKTLWNICSNDIHILFLN